MQETQIAGHGTCFCSHFFEVHCKDYRGRNIKLRLLGDKETHGPQWLQWMDGGTNTWVEAREVYLLGHDGGKYWIRIRPGLGRNLYIQPAIINTVSTSRETRVAYPQHKHQYVPIVTNTGEHHFLRTLVTANSFISQDSTSENNWVSSSGEVFNELNVVGEDDKSYRIAPTGDYGFQRIRQGNDVWQKFRPGGFVPIRFADGGLYYVQQYGLRFRIRPAGDRNQQYLATYLNLLNPRTGAPDCFRAVFRPVPE